MAAEDKISFGVITKKVTAGDVGPSANATVSPGSAMTIPFVQYDEYGDIIGAVDRTLTLNSNILDSADIMTSFSGATNAKVPGAALVNTQLGTKEPTQKRASWNSGDNCYYRKCGYTCFIHCSNEQAEYVVKTLPAGYRPTAEVTLSGWCLNESSGGYYPVVGVIKTDGTWNYLTAMTEFAMKSEYYIYNPDTGTNRLKNFKVWLAGAWATNTNGA